MAYNEKQTQCIALLQETAKALGRLPQKSDFSPEVIGQIKNILGPAPCPRGGGVEGAKGPTGAEDPTAHPSQAAAHPREDHTTEGDRA